MTRVGDISAALAYQVKKEIAENYFGTRKTLEEEREELLSQMDQLLTAWEREVLPILDRIFYYLVDRETGKRFLSLIHQDEWLESLKATRENQGPKPIGSFGSPAFALTLRGKYNHLILSLYRKAEDKAGSLIQALNILLKKGHLFNEELAGFQARFNLMDILSFIKTIENLDDLKGVMGENTDPRAIPALERAMVIKPVTFTREGVPLIRPLPPLTEIKKSLSQLVDRTFQDHGPEVKKRLRED